MKKTYILDTNVFLTNANSVYEFRNNDIIVPLKVLDEIDKHKKRQDGVGLNARSIIRILDELRSKGNLHKGVRIRRGKGILSVRGYDLEDLPVSCDIESADNEILTTALTEMKKNPKRKVILVTRDINMRVKCDSLEIMTEDYATNKVVTDEKHLFTGFKKHLVDDQLIDQFYEGEHIFFDKEDGKFFPNQFIMLVSSSNEKKSALARFMNYESKLEKVVETRDAVWGLKPRNKEQTFALDLLNDPDIPIVTLVGKAGCGKTLLAIAAGLDFLLNGESKSMEMFFEDGTIQIEALTYIRGRSISNAFVIIDEAQNLTMHELKTIITRVGENTKIVLTGDVEQIDSVYLDATSNGLSYAVEKFKQHGLAGHVTLLKGERSKVATLASKIL